MGEAIYRHTFSSGCGHSCNNALNCLSVLVIDVDFNVFT